MQHNGANAENTTPAADTAANRQKLELLNSRLASLLRQALQRGFHGDVAIEIAVQDGTIQHVRQRLERIER
jgi:hypothetical protein